MKKTEDEKKAIKLDIIRFYFSGKIKLKELRSHYGMSAFTMNALVTEAIKDMNKNPNCIY